MATNAIAKQPALSAQALQRVGTRGWRRGLANLLTNEHRGWWATSRWLLQMLAWLALINGAVAGTASQARAQLAAGTPAGEVSLGLLQVLFQVGTMATAMGAVTSTQGALIREKQLGTAAWVLSKPVSRSAFLLAKLAAYATALLAVAVALPSVVGYGEIWWATGRAPGALSFVAGVGVWAVHLLFYVTLTLMLGTLLASRGPVVGIGLGFVFAGSFVPSLIPPAALIFPWALGGLGAVLAAGTDVPAPISPISIVPVLATILWTGLFMMVALWRFQREEF